MEASRSHDLIHSFIEHALRLRNTFTSNHHQLHAQPATKSSKFKETSHAHSITDDWT